MRRRPHVGETVNYFSYGTPNGEYKPERRAAIITEVSDDPLDYTVGLCVLNPTGMFFNRDVEFSFTAEPGTWSWLLTS